MSEDNEDESGTRNTWKILTWIMVGLTLALNLVIIIILLVRRNVYSVITKAILLVAFLDLLYGMTTSPFFVENYINLHWDQGLEYCRFYIYYFTFHDLFIPLILTLLSTYVSLKYAGITDSFNYKRIAFVTITIVVLIISLLLSIPATYYSNIFIENPPDGVFKKECRSWDNYTMTLTYCLASSLLFCFTMSFLFSLCIVGSPFLSNLYDREEYSQRWRLLLTLSLVNIFYILSGFLLNFKEISRVLFVCCDIEKPFIDVNSLTYDVWSFVLLAGEPFFRPLMYLVFYFKYLLTDPAAY